MTDSREPLFSIPTLTGNDTVTTWLTRTNQIISSINSLYVADIFEGDGICSFRTDGIVTIKVDPGPGIGFTNTKELTISFNNVSLLSGTTTNPSPVNNTDLFLLERSGLLRKVQASSLLPTTINHPHTFTQDITFAASLLLNPTANLYTNWNSVISPGLNAKKGLRFKGLYNLWSFENNLSLNSSQAYAVISENVNDNLSSVFNFATHIDKSTQLNTDIDDVRPTSLLFNFNVGGAPSNWATGSVNDTVIWPATWSMKFDFNSINIYHRGSTSTDDDEVIVSLQKLGSYNNHLALNTSIYISDLESSPQFIQTPDTTSYKIPVTLSTGLLDKKFTNRIVTTDYSGVLVSGDLVAISTETDGSSEYIKAFAVEGENYDVVGIVESVSATVATIALNGEFQLSGGTALEPGTKYYLSQTNPGEYVEESSLTTGGIIKPVFVALTSNTGILISSGGVVSNNIGSITVNYKDTDEEETLNINSANYNLKLVAGSNIKFDVTPNDEISVRVVDLAGAQDTFKTISVNGVGSDGDGSTTANLPATTLNLISNTLSLSANNTTKTITLEAPNAFKSFVFDDAEATGLVYTMNPETTSDTLRFIAGTNIVFEQTTDDCVKISAQLTSGVRANDIIFNTVPVDNNLRRQYAFVVSNPSSSELVSLYGGTGSDGFTSDWANIDTGDIALDPTKTIVLTAPSGVHTWTYNNIAYTLDSSYGDAGYSTFYLPDDLAGFMIGRITPSAFDGSSNPSNKISRLTRKDVRFFLGLAPDGFIDAVNKVYRQWTVVNGPGAGPIIEAASKNGSLRFECGTGIQIEDGDFNGSPSIKITNTGTAQNAYSNISVYSYEGSLTSELFADNSSDTLHLNSGKFVKISGDTNDDLTFDISVDDDYVILGNSGTTDGMGLIDLSSTNNCFVGRVAGGEIKAITSSDLAWTGSSDPRVAPLMQMPYFGLVKVNGGGAPGYLNASTTGQLTFESSGSITLNFNSSTNTVTIGGTGGGGSSTPTISQVSINTSDFTVNNTTFNKLAFQNSNNLIFNGTLNPAQSRLEISCDIKPIPGNSVLVNNTSAPNSPTSLILNANTVLGVSNSTIRALGSSELRQVVGVGKFSNIAVLNGAVTTAVNLESTLSSVFFSSGFGLEFIAGTNVSLTAGTNTASERGTITINAATNLTTDTNPRFNTTLYENDDLGDPTAEKRNATRIRYGNNNGILTSGAGAFTILEECGMGNGTTISYCLTNSKTIMPLGGATGGVFTTTVISNPENNALPTLILNSSVIVEKTYTTDYVRTITSDNTGGLGSYTLNSGNLSYNTSGNILFTTAQQPPLTSGQFLNFNNLKIKGIYVGLNDSGVQTTVTNTLLVSTTNSTSYFTIRSVSGNNNNVTAAAGLRFSTNDQGVLFSLEKDQNNTIDFRKVTSAYVTATSVPSSSTTISSTGSLVFLTDAKFGPASNGSTKINIDFSGANITGLTPGAHANTHQFAVSESTNGSTPPGADAIAPWKVGAVNRALPTMRNVMCITSGDSSLDFNNNNAINPATIYSNATYATVFNDSLITNTSRGPMYVVLASGQETSLQSETAGTAKGPPGQIIFIRKT
jgi:hypothetical protein